MAASSRSSLLPREITLYLVFVKVVIKTINPNQITDQLNRCYLNYDPRWPTGKGNILEEEFKKYIEESGGIQLHFDPKINGRGQWGYSVIRVDIIDEHKFTIWMLKWT